MLTLPRTANGYLVFFLGAVILLFIGSGSMLWSLATNKSWRPYPRESNSQSSMQPNIVQQSTFYGGRLPDSLTKLYDGVEKFVVFIGYPRSGHSLVGAILDAHPEIIVPHEYSLLSEWNKYKNSRLEKFGVTKYLLFHELHTLSTFQAMFGIRSSTPVYMNGHLYSYNISGGWQGTHNGHLKVIGDKKGGAASKALKNPDNFKKLEEIQKTVGVPLKFVHVIRNPFDNIATQVLRNAGARNKVKDGKTKIDNARLLNKSITSHFGRLAANKQVKQLYGDAVLDILGHELLQNTRETMNKMCRFFGVTCYEDYIRVVEKLLHGKPSITRNTVVWTQDQKDWVNKEMKKYSFLQPYSFDSEY